MARPYPFLPLTHGPPLLYWLGTSWWYLSLVCAPLPCVSIACLLFICLPWPEGLSMHPTAHSWPLVAWMGFWAFVLYGLFPLWVRSCLIVGFSLFSPFFALFVGLLALLPCHSIIHAVVLLDSCLLGFFWACCMLFFYLILVAQYYHWASIHAILGFLDPFYCLQASSAHFLLLGHPEPISFPQASSAHSNSAFLLAFAKSFGLSRPIYHILYFWGSWASHQPLTQLIHYFGSSLAHSCLLSI